MKNRRIIFIILILALGYYFYTHNNQQNPMGKPVKIDGAETERPEDNPTPEKMVSKEAQKAIDPAAVLAGGIFEEGHDEGCWVWSKHQIEYIRFNVKDNHY